VTATDSATRLTLMAWLSPAFPVGAFAYSQGLESVHASGGLEGAQALHDWLATLLEHGSLRNDAILLGLAWRAARADDRAAVSELNEFAVALAASSERRLETTAQGRAFARAVETSWAVPALEAWLAALAAGPLAYPVAVGLAAAAHDLPLLPTLEAYLFAALGNLVSAATRLGAVGQTDAQRVLARLAPCLPSAARLAAAAERGEIGGVALRAELFAFRHETLYSRLFRT
jgi:urease accessory protein